MDYKNIFTTYNSVDPPAQITPQISQDEVYTKPDNTLYKLLDRLESSIQEPSSNSQNSEQSLKDRFEKVEQPKKTLFKDQQEFIDIMRPIYQRILQQKGLDINYVDYLVAQSALESNWGKSQSGKNNLGGIKVPTSQKGKGLGTVRKTREVINGKDVYIDDEFRDFKDLEDYASYQVDLLNGKRYNAFSGDFITNVVKGGYATDPKYKSVLTNIFNQIKS